MAQNKWLEDFGKTEKRGNLYQLSHKEGKMGTMNESAVDSHQYLETDYGGLLL